MTRFEDGLRALSYNDLRRLASWPAEYWLDGETAGCCWHLDGKG